MLTNHLNLPGCLAVVKFDAEWKIRRGESDGTEVLHAYTWIGVMRPFSHRKMIG